MNLVRGGLFGVVVALFLVMTGHPASAAQPVWKTNEQINYGSGTAKFTLIHVDMTNPRIQVTAATPGDKIGTTASLADLISGETDEDGTAVAGINGTFFNAYADMQPYGTIIRNGEVQHISNTGSVLGIDANNQVRIDAVYTRLLGSTLGQTDWPYNWEAWNINHYYDSSSAIMLFSTSYGGPRPAHGFSAIEIQNNVVTKVSVGTFNIPADGYLIITGNADVVKKFPIGRSMDFAGIFLQNSYGQTPVANQGDLPWGDVKTALGAGPTLVKNGVVVVDPVKEKFSEPKILTNKAQRSFVGVTANRQMLMASVSSVTVNELAEIAKKLGCVQAINMDGGASSGTWMANMADVPMSGTPAKGSYITTPGRKLSNALVVRMLKEDPIRVTLNGANLFFDADPYVNKDYGRTLVPMRKIAVALGAQVTYDGATRAIVITKGRTVAKFKVNDKNAEVNGVPTVLELPLIVRNGRSYIPARYLADLLGAAVDWIPATRTVTLMMKTYNALLKEGIALEASGKAQEAVDHYLMMLEQNPSDLSVLRRIAPLYSASLGKHRESASMYALLVKLDPNNTAYANSLAWEYYSAQQYAEGIAFLESLITSGKATATHYMIMGHIYASFQMQQKDKARFYYEKVLTMNPSDSDKKYVENWLAKN